MGSFQNKFRAEGTYLADQTEILNTGKMVESTDFLLSKPAKNLSGIRV